jgi:hypothetical protein
MNNNNAKAQMSSFLLTLMIILVSLFIFVRFFEGTADIATKHQYAEVCRESIETNAIGHIAGLDFYEDVKCPTEYIEEESTDDAVIKKTVADAMTSCWFKMGEGKYEVFDTATGTTQYCVMCSVVEFDTKGQIVPGFVAYLKEHNVPRIYTRGKDILYTKYMHGYLSDDAVALLDEYEETDVIDTTYDYAVIFLYAKKGYINKIWATIGGAAIGTVGGSVLIISGAGLPAGIALIGGTVAGGTAGYAVGADKITDWESALVVYPYTTESLQSLNCEKLPVKQ